MRYALRTAAALLAGLPLPWLLALAREDPLWTTVQVAPAVLVALWQLELWAASHGGWARRWRDRALEAGLLGLWLLAVGLRAAWGAEAITPFLAAAWFAGVGWRAWRLLPRLRPSLGSRLPARPPTPFFWLPFVVYVAVLPWATGQRPPDGDEPYYLLLTHSLAYDGDADLADNYLRQDSRRFMDRALEPQPGDPVGPEGERYSRHNVLLPLVLAAPYRVAGLAGAAGAMAALTALLAWWFLRVARLVAPDRPGEVLLAWGLLAFTPPLLLYSSQFWVEIPAALLLLVGWELASRPGGPGRPRHWLLLLGASALLVLLKLRFVVVAAPLLVLGLVRSGHRWRALVGLGAFGAVTSAVLVFNEIRFDSALKTYSLADLSLLGRPPAEYLLAGSGLWFDAAFGLLAAAPLWVLLIPAGIAALAARPRLLAALVLVLGPYGVLLASRTEWFGGWSPPFRYGLPVLPLLALLLPPLLEGRRRAGPRALLGALTVLTAAVTLVWLVVPGWTYNLADGGSHLGDALAAALGADVNRLLPSMVRPRLATWLWPLLVSAVVPALWWGSRRRTARAFPFAVAGLLALLAAAPLLAARCPTRRVELEDPPVRSRGGRLYPPPWTVERVRWPSGTMLPEGASLAVPVVPGGDRVRIRLRLRGVANERRTVGFEVGDGERILYRERLELRDDWSELVIGPVSWVVGRELTVALDPPPPGRTRNGVALDRAELEW
jgi:hypothetical protein